MAEEQDTIEQTDDEQPVSRALKFVGPDTIEGLAFPFDSPDTDAESFTKATDRCLDWFPEGRPLLYHHGLDNAHKAQKVGRQLPEEEERAGGIWLQSQLDKNARYRKAIDRLIEEGALGYSSGAYAHLATKNARNQITRWPWIELSLTPIPAHPATLGVHYIKSASAFLDLFEEEEVPPAVKAALSALDEWAYSRDPDAAPGTESLDEKAGRATAAALELRDHARAYAQMRAKAGRVLSAATRERLLRHPELLREVAGDLDALLSEADAEKSETKSTTELRLASAVAISRSLGIELPAERTH